MQRKKNIKLFVILSIMIVITVATYFLLQRDNGNSFQDVKLFAMDDVSKIDSVVFNKNEKTQTLHYAGNNWLVNGKYNADAQKLTVFFAALNQVRVRRPVADAEEDFIDSLFNKEGTSITFFEEDNIVHEFEVAGNSENSLTYFRRDNETFIVHIPGYRSYLTSIFVQNTSDWRDKLVFDDVSWSNLEKVEVRYPSNEGGFIVDPSGGFYTIQGTTETDSTRLLDYLDKVSLLMADEFLLEGEQDTLISSNAMLSVAVTDIRNRPFTLNVYETSLARKYVALKDSSQWLLLDKSKVEPLLRKKEYFIGGE